MAPTSEGDAASQRASILGLTKTYERGEKEPSFSELMSACRTSAVHLEMHDQHMTSDPDFQDWLAGRPAPVDLLAHHSVYTDVIREAVGRGVTVRRARIVAEPVSDYVRWEHGLTRPMNMAAGEDVRWLPRRFASTLLLPGNSYWIFDDRRVRFSVFRGDGEVHCRQHSTDRAVIELCTAAFKQVWGLAIPHDEYQL